CIMVRRCVATLLVVAGFGILACALGNGSAFAQTQTSGAPGFGSGPNTCCVQASRIRFAGGTCPALVTKNFTKDVFCPDASTTTCPLLVPTPSPDPRLVAGAFFTDLTQNGGCAIQGGHTTS